MNASRKMIIVFAAAIAIGLPGSSAIANSGLVTLAGKCQKMMYGKDNLAPYCNPAIASSNAGGNKVMFHWGLADGTLLTIVSTDLPNPSADTDATKIIRLHIKGGALNANATAAATGKCTFGNPYRGKATISCKGKADGKKFDFTFRTDGRPPR